MTDETEKYTVLAISFIFILYLSNVIELSLQLGLVS